jgi:hypothetical protein
MDGAPSHKTVSNHVCAKSSSRRLLILFDVIAARLDAKLALGVHCIFHGAPLHLAAAETLKIYAATETARHFGACCIKPVTGLIVSRCLLPLWTRPFASGNRRKAFS